VSRRLEGRRKHTQRGVGPGDQVTRLAALLLTGIALAACGILNPPKPQMSVRESVLRSWQGVDVIVLERHQWFSYRRPEIRTLSDGTETWVYSTCRSRQSGSSGTFVSNWGSSTGSSATAWEECCHSQFFIRPGSGGAKQVVEYRPTRNCAIDCTVAAGGCRR
jgi:hypothetical protein